MAALRDIARSFAAEIRDGIGWVIVYRTGRSWHGVTVWGDVASDEWETDDINEALDVLKVDPKAVLLNGYYCGHFAEDMTADEIAAGIRWHYENGYNQLADNNIISGIVDGIEEARLRAAEAGLPFSDRLADGAEDEVNPYVYDGSMTLEDYEAMQAAREADRANEELAAVVRARTPNISEEAMQQILDAAGGLHIDPETIGCRTARRCPRTSSPSPASPTGSSRPRASGPRRLRPTSSSCCGRAPSSWSPTTRSSTPALSGSCCAALRSAGSTGWTA